MPKGTTPVLSRFEAVRERLVKELERRTLDPLAVKAMPLGELEQMIRVCRDSISSIMASEGGSIGRGEQQFKILTYVPVGRKGEVMRWHAERDGPLAEFMDGAESKAKDGAQEAKVADGD